MSERDCTVEMVDGQYDYEGCGCEDCCDELHEEIEHRVESGYLDEDEARDEHAGLTARGY